MAVLPKPEGKAIRYGAECCPKTIEILNRHGGVTIGPKYTDEDVADVVKAIRKVYHRLGPGVVDRRHRSLQLEESARCDCAIARALVCSSCLCPPRYRPAPAIG